MLFGNTSVIAAQNAKNSLTPLQKADKNIKKYTKLTASTQGAEVAANDKYNNLLNKYYNDLSYSRSARITALDTPDSGDIWSSPEAAQSFYWQTSGAKQIKSLKSQVKTAIQNNSQLAADLSKYQNMLQQSEQNKSYAIQHQMQMANIFAGILDSFLGIFGMFAGAFA